MDENYEYLDSIEVYINPTLNQAPHQDESQEGREGTAYKYVVT
jgi:hypothetical protein